MLSQARGYRSISLTASDSESESDPVWFSELISRMWFIELATSRHRFWIISYAAQFSSLVFEINQSVHSLWKFCGWGMRSNTDISVRKVKTIGGQLRGAPFTERGHAYSRVLRMANPPWARAYKARSGDETLVYVCYWCGGGRIM